MLKCHSSPPKPKSKNSCFWNFVEVHFPTAQHLSVSEGIERRSTRKPFLFPLEASRSLALCFHPLRGMFLTSIEVPAPLLVPAP
jgi:hypothetical protein